MIKALHTANGRVVVLLGLTDENIRRMGDDQPVRVSLDEFGLEGFSGDVVVFTGRDENTMMEQMMAGGLLGPDTKLSIDPRFIPDHPPPELRDVVETIILQLPADLCPPDLADGEELRAWMRAQALAQIHHAGGAHKIEVTQLTWTLSANADDVAKMAPPHECARCRQGMESAVNYLRRHPDRWLGIGRAAYRMHVDT